MNNNELTHHGIKGMKWGVRRFQDKSGRLTPAGKKRASNKEVRNERQKVYEKEYKNLSKEYGIEDKKAKAIAYGKKHKLDLDDGGGGTRKAGEKYMSMWDDIDDLSDRASTEANKRAKQYVIDTYGEKKVRSIQRADNAKAIAFTTAFFGLPLVGVGIVAAADLKK